MTYPIPAEAFDDRLAVTGTSGSGKTYSVLGALARLMKDRRRFIAADALGVMYGLRLKADGVTPSDFKPVIFGGPHGDLPLTVAAAPLLGEAAAGMAESVILDLSQLGTKAAERRFMLGFLKALEKNANREPVHLIFDEADLWAPQKIFDKEGEAMKLLGVMDNIVRRGRIKGFIPWLITQRPAVLSKDVLSQADGVVAMKLTGSQDRDALGAWIEGAADRAKGKEILGLMPTLDKGEGVIWIPGRQVLKTARFPENSTFDSSRTPKRGESIRRVDLKPLDLGKLKDRLATVEDEAKANDPVALKAQVAQLAADLAKARKVAGAARPTPEAPKDVQAALRDQERAFEAGQREGHSQGWEDGWIAGYNNGFRTGFQDVQDKARAAFKAMVLDPGTPTPPKPPKTFKAAALPVAVALSPRVAAALRSTPEKVPVPIFPSGSHPGSRAHTAVIGASGLKPAIQRALDAVAWWDKVGKSPVERARAAVVAGLSPKASTFNVYVAELLKLGFLETSPAGVALTEEGRKAANFPNMVTSEDSYQTSRSLLSPQEQRVFDLVYAGRGQPITRAYIAEEMGLSPTASTTNVYIAGVAQYGIIETAGPGMVKAADWLFV